ncbi:MAG: hypothetical protein JW867_06390 [Candidatus Omnitrophica bacterium]|nr:hypothetical protein [Candidatus Omnitrophota bacterium]
MEGLVCKVCGHIALIGVAPEKCPVCGAPAKSFEKKPDAVVAVKEPAKPTDFEKKHTPAITIVRKCGLIPEGCIDAHVKIGGIQHPMQSDHFIQYIDFYIDKKYISRVYLTPDKLNPAAALHLKPTSGRLTAIESCNLHGRWIAEAEI